MTLDYALDCIGALLGNEAIPIKRDFKALSSEVERSPSRVNNTSSYASPNKRESQSVSRVEPDKYEEVVSEP